MEQKRSLAERAADTRERARALVAESKLLREGIAAARAAAAASKAELATATCQRLHVTRTLLVLPAYVLEREHLKGRRLSVS